MTQTKLCPLIMWPPLLSLPVSARLSVLDLFLAPRDAPVVSELSSGSGGGSGETASLSGSLFVWLSLVGIVFSFKL